MKRHIRMAFSFLLLAVPSLAGAQDARSMAIGGAAVAGFNGPFSIYWNPAGLSSPEPGSSAWSVDTGYSTFHTSNSDSPILRFDDTAARASGQDPVSESLQDLGLVAVQYLSYGGGVLYDHELNAEESQGTYRFFDDEGSGAITDIPNLGRTYNFNEDRTSQDIETLILSYSTPLPLTAFQFISAGFNLKYHYGSAYSRTFLDGSYTQGSGGSYRYTQTTSTSGLGLSTDLGLMAKLTDSLQVGVMLQNLTSSFNWTAQKQAYQLDDTTGTPSPDGPAQSVTVSAPMPYAVRVGVLAEPPGTDTFLNAQADFTQAKTHWKIGVERFYPSSNLVVRLGTFNDEVSGDQLWTFGAGYTTSAFNLDAAVVTRSLPNVEDSVALGGSVDAAVRF